MDFVETYLEKQNFKPNIAAKVPPNLGICIVIPCYNEPHLNQTLDALYKCDRTLQTTEVIIVVNSHENSEPLVVKRNEMTITEAESWIKKHTDPLIHFHFIYEPKLPAKFAGVGLARKIGMDEATYRLHKANNLKGIIAGFDADAVCSPNYLIALENHFKRHLKTPGASIYFEHPIDKDDINNLGIILYELHLRYLNLALRYTGHPHAWHTVGSSFAVRMDAYVKQGGMNRRQAGEDFYFLQKIIALGNYTKINETIVIPSPRESNRVPFGTGAAMQKWRNGQGIKTYQLTTFKELKKLFDLVNKLYSSDIESVEYITNSLPISIKKFLEEHNFKSELNSIQSNSASLETFRNRFFRWFNAFRVIKYLNCTNTSQADIFNEAKELINLLGISAPMDSPYNLLTTYRNLEREKTIQQ